MIVFVGPQDVNVAHTRSHDQRAQAYPECGGELDGFHRSPHRASESLQIIRNCEGPAEPGSVVRANFSVVPRGFICTERPPRGRLEIGRFFPEEARSEEARGW